MHTSDGLLTSWVCVVYWLLAIFFIRYCYQRMDIAPSKRRLFAGLISLIFVLQLLNFPLTSGISGHFIGAALLAVVFGPYAGVIGMAIILSLQALLFGDGGIFSFGANVASMGIAGSFSASFVYKHLKEHIQARTGAQEFSFLAYSVASLFSVLCSFAVASASIAISYPFVGSVDGSMATGDLLKTLVGLLGLHVVIGIIEGFIGFFILGMVTIELKKDRAVSLAYITSFLLAAALLPFSSMLPDAFQAVTAQFGYFEYAASYTILIPFAGYNLFGFSGYFFSLISAAIGILIAYRAGRHILSRAYP